MLVEVKEGVHTVATVQERNIIGDRKTLKSLWTVREVCVDRPFDVHQTTFENADYCILAPPSRRLSQHLLQAMHHERKDQKLRFWVPLMLVILGFAIVTCMVFGCGADRCFIWPLVSWLNGLLHAHDCWWNEKPCQVQSLPWVRGLGDTTMKILLLVFRFACFLLLAVIYGSGACYCCSSIVSWLQCLFRRSPSAQEEEDDRRHGRHSLDAPRDRYALRAGTFYATCRRIHDLSRV